MKNQSKFLLFIFTLLAVSALSSSVFASHIVGHGVTNGPAGQLIFPFTLDTHTGPAPGGDGVNDAAVFLRITNVSNTTDVVIHWQFFDGATCEEFLDFCSPLTRNDTDTFDLSNLIFDPDNPAGPGVPITAFRPGLRFGFAVATPTVNCPSDYRAIQFNRLIGAVQIGSTATNAAISLEAYGRVAVEGLATITGISGTGVSGSDPDIGTTPATDFVISDVGTPVLTGPTYVVTRTVTFTFPALSTFAEHVTTALATLTGTDCAGTLTTLILTPPDPSGAGRTPTCTISTAATTPAIGGGPFFQFVQPREDALNHFFAEVIGGTDFSSTFLQEKCFIRWEDTYCAPAAAGGQYAARFVDGVFSGSKVVGDQTFSITPFNDRENAISPFPTRTLTKCYECVTIEDLLGGTSGAQWIATRGTGGWLFLSGFSYTMSFSAASCTVITSGPSAGMTRVTLTIATDSRHNDNLIQYVNQALFQFAFNHWGHPLMPRDAVRFEYFGSIRP